MLGSLTIGTTNLTTAYRVYTTDAPIYNSPEPDVKSVSIQGRSGDLLIDNNRYRNIVVEYPCVIPAATGNQMSAANCLAGLRSFLLLNRGYLKIADSFNVSEYRLGRYVGGLEVHPTITGDAATFTLVFSCKPQRWLVSGDQEITLTRQSSDSMYFGYFQNPTQFHSLPIVTLTGTGSGNVQIYKAAGSADYISTTIRIDNLDGTIIIDCELQDAYFENTNLNDKITLTSGRFFEVASGWNNVQVSTAINTDTIKIIPRWWTL